MELLQEQEELTGTLSVAGQASKTGIEVNNSLLPHGVNKAYSNCKCKPLQFPMYMYMYVYIVCTCVMPRNIIMHVTYFLQIQWLALNRNSIKCTNIIIIMVD